MDAVMSSTPDVEFVADPCGQDPSAAVNAGAAAGGSFHPFQQLADGFLGNMIVLHQESGEGRDHLSRSCAMRVDSADEMIRVFQVFFEL